MRKVIYINSREIAHLEYHKIPKGCHIDNILVEEKHRGEGYGKQLIEKLGKYEIVTVVPTPETLKFWYRLGFREQGDVYVRENKKPYVNTQLFQKYKQGIEPNKRCYHIKLGIILFCISLTYIFIWYAFSQK